MKFVVHRPNLKSFIYANREMVSIKLIFGEENIRPIRKNKKTPNILENKHA